MGKIDVSAFGGIVGAVMGIVALHSLGIFAPLAGFVIGALLGGVVGKIIRKEQ